MKNIFLIILIAVIGVSTACNRTRGNQSSSSGSSDNAAQSQAPSGTGGGQDKSQTGGGQLSSADRDFIINAAKGGKAEVELGTLASEHAQNPAVKQFGRRMVTDHSEANAKLQQIAQQKGISLPTDLPDDAQQLKQQLTSAQGMQFDKTYIQNMVQDHQKDVAEFQKEAEEGQDPDIKNFAATTLPTLKQHLQLAESTASKVSK
jgi:putative membrane protein